MDICTSLPACVVQDSNLRHELDRSQVQEVVCSLCDLRQPVATHCTRCSVEFGAYSCLKCNFFDDDTSKQQFHCDLCGICRVGGAENYFHCYRCGCCYGKSLRVRTFLPLYKQLAHSTEASGCCSTSGLGAGLQRNCSYPWPGCMEMVFRKECSRAIRVSTMLPKPNVHAHSQGRGPPQVVTFISTASRPAC